MARTLQAETVSIQVPVSGTAAQEVQVKIPREKVRRGRKDKKNVDFKKITNALTDMDIIDAPSTLQEALPLAVPLPAVQVERPVQGLAARCRAKRRRSRRGERQRQWRRRGAA